MTFILPPEFLPSPLVAAANLIGVITSNKALEDAKSSFPSWQMAARRCAGLTSANVCARFHNHGDPQAGNEQGHP